MHVVPGWEQNPPVTQLAIAPEPPVDETPVPPVPTLPPAPPLPLTRASGTVPPAPPVPSVPVSRIAMFASPPDPPASPVADVLLQARATDAIETISRCFVSIEYTVAADRLNGSHPISEGK